MSPLNTSQAKMAWLPQQMRFYLTFAFVNTISYVYTTHQVYYNKLSHKKTFVT